MASTVSPITFPPQLRQCRPVEIGRTEKIKDSLDPRWQTKFLLDYKFEERQIFRFAIYDIDSDSRQKLDDHDSLGHIDCSLGEVSENN